MNWDISLGHLRQWYGRSLQRVGTRFENRRLVMSGERAEYRGRLQVRYGAVKHQAQWNWNSLKMQPQPIRSTDKTVS